MFDPVSYSATDWTASAGTLSDFVVENLDSLNQNTFAGIVDTLNNFEIAKALYSPFQNLQGIDSWYGTNPNTTLNRIKDANVNIQLENIGTMDLSATATQIENLNKIMEGTTGTVTCKIYGFAHILAELDTDTGAPTNTQNLELVVISPATVAQGVKIVNSTLKSTVDFQGGISDTFANLSDNISTKLSHITDKDSDLDIYIDRQDSNHPNNTEYTLRRRGENGVSRNYDVMTDSRTSFNTNVMNASKVTLLNSIMNETSGQIWAFIKGTSSVLSNLESDSTIINGLVSNYTKNQYLSIVVDNSHLSPPVGTTVNEARKISDSTKHTTDQHRVVFVQGVRDSFANFALSNSGAPIDVANTMTRIKDDNLQIVISDLQTNIHTSTDKDNLNKILDGTLGYITATINGPASVLSGLNVNYNNWQNNTPTPTVVGYDLFGTQEGLKQNLAITVTTQATLEEANRIVALTYQNTVEFKDMSNVDQGVLDSF